MSSIDELIKIGDTAKDFAKNIYNEYGYASPVFACEFVRELGVLLDKDPIRFCKMICEIVETVDVDEKEEK